MIKHLSLIVKKTLKLFCQIFRQKRRWFCWPPRHRNLQSGMSFILHMLFITFMNQSHNTCILKVKKCIRFENTPCRNPTIHVWGRMNNSFPQMGSSIKITMSASLSLSCSLWSSSKITSGVFIKSNIFWPGDLDIWPMTLSFKLDLDILPLDLHTKNQVCMSFCSAVRVVTDGWTDRHTDNVKTITPVADTGCNYYVGNENSLNITNHLIMGSRPQGGPYVIVEIIFSWFYHWW